MRVVTILFLVFRSLQCQNTTIEIVDIALKCQTPENEEGFCLPLNECPTLNNRQTDPKFKEELAKSKCNNSSLYCCDNALTTLKFTIPCKTPDDLDGMCVRIQDCPKLYDALENPKMKGFIKNSQCIVRKPNRKFPIVCCQTENTPSVVSRFGLFPSTCGTQSIQMKQRIFGGTEASLGEFPWMALIIHKKETYRQFGCSGFLISAKFVLTAAHCINGTNERHFGKMIEIVLGEHNRATEIDCDEDNNCALPIQRIKIKKAVSHPLYHESNSHNYNDIGIIQLTRVANFTKFVQPICMFSMDKPMEYWLSGWGSTQSERLSEVKLKVDIPEFDLKRCISKYATINLNVTNNQLCAGGVSGKDSCQGDSGGPLMYVSNNKWYAAGVVSYGLGCGRADWPGVYTNINSYEEWITSTVAKLNKKNQNKTL